MNKYDQAWRKLAAAARRAAPAGDESAPFGFSTRVAALALGAESPSPSIFARLSLRAAAVAGIVAAIAVAVNYSAIKGAFDNESAVAANDDPVAEVVNLGS
ncbi:MAG TPA: hypothetical protein VN775_06325 [Opitutaceae bacterium]|nr:hypothetical protein [Opitutaceae bacterium]